MDGAGEHEQDGYCARASDVLDHSGAARGASWARARGWSAAIGQTWRTQQVGRRVVFRDGLFSHDMDRSTSAYSG